MRDDDRTYDAAVRQLAKTITGKKRADPGALTWDEQFAQLETYVQRLDMRASVDALRVVHVAGTKGKGSTCAMVEAMLQGERDAGGDVHEPALDGRARAISDRRGDGGRGDVREGVLVDARRDRGAVRRSGDAGVL